MTWRWLRRCLASDARGLVDKLWSYCNVARDHLVGTIVWVGSVAECVASL
jgi:hypothetical protein